MGLFKEVRKPVIKGAAAGSGDVSPLRPRCVEKTPPCADRCPHGQEIREVLVGIAQCQAYGRTPAQALELAWKRITERNPFPAVCGRVCQHPCELACNRKAKDGAVAIHLIERSLGDYAIAQRWKLTKLEAAPAAAAVAIVGAGPAGLSCAYQLVRRGYAVTIFDAAPQPGGMMRYRMPRSVVPSEVLDAEIANLLELDVKIQCGSAVGRDITLADLHRDYAAVFFATGLQKASQLTLRHEGEGAVLAGELPAGPPPDSYAEAGDLDARVANSISPAIAQGRVVAEAIHAFLSGRQPESKTPPPVIKPEKIKLDWYPAAPPHAEVPPALPLGLTEAAAVEEAKRCMSCGMCMDCETCWMYCSANCFVKLPKGEHYRIKLELCNGCKKCMEACPCGYIEMN